MTEESREPRVNGAPETEWACNPPGIDSVASQGEPRNVDELLDLGRDPFEACAASYFTVAIHLVECERPANHPDGCGPLRDEDLEPEGPYPVPDRHEYTAEMADARHDEAMSQ